MSQHIFSTHCNGKPVDVLMGWDRPLQGFFLVIEVTQGDAEEYVYSNLEDRSLTKWMGLPPTLKPFEDKLQELGIEVPNEMLHQVRQDRVNNVGNRHIVYNADGTALT